MTAECRQKNATHITVCPRACVHVRRRTQCEPGFRPPTINSHW